MKEQYFLGVDPGKKGGAAVISARRVLLDSIAFEKGTEKEIANFFRIWSKEATTFCYLEKVHSMPKQGVRSMFTFGQNYGFVRACLLCFEIRFIEIAPKVWQKKLGCLTGGDKKVTRGKAQQLFPLVDPVTNAIADAMLLAWSARVFMDD